MFGELAVNGTNYVGFRAPDSIAANVIWVLPSAAAAVSGYVLTSNAANTLSWQTRFPQWATATPYAVNDVVIAKYESEYRFWIARSAFTSSGVTFPGSQTIAVPPAYTGNWQEISPLRGGVGGVDLDDSVSYNNTVTPPALTADVNNYAPSGIAHCNFLRLSTSGGGSYRINGLLAPAVPTNNQLLFISNIGTTGNITLVNAASTSLPANRFSSSNNITIRPSDGVTVLYDFISARWRGHSNNA